MAGMSDADTASASRHLVELTREECFELLEYHSFVGRLGFVDGGKPMILPVNYLADAQSIVFCTGSGTKLDRAREGAAVVFEIDGSRPLEHAGWSVVVHGTAHEITDPTELELLRRGPLKSWAVSPGEHWVRVSIDEISGRRIA